MTTTDVNWLVSDINHTFVKKGCHDSVAIDVAERLAFIEQSRDGRLESRYW